jgi:hypothetical protein
MAPEAPSDAYCGSFAMLEVGADVAEQLAREVEPRKGGGTDASLELERKKPERHHVEDQVRQVAVHETGREQRGVLPPPQEPVRSEQAASATFGAANSATRLTTIVTAKNDQRYAQ